MITQRTSPEFERLLLLEIEAAERARNGFLEFILYTKPNYRVNWHHLLIAKTLEKFFRGDIRRLMVFMPPRHGKLCADATPVLTVDGWKAHGDLKPGDFVFHPSGKAVKVLSVGEPSFADIRIHFSNGDFIDCHENHEWEIFDRSYGKFFIREAKTFLKVTKFKRPINILSKNGRVKYQLRNISAIRQEERRLSLHPYVLGAWLGDGTTGAARITYSKDDRLYIQKIIALGYRISSEYTHKKTGVLTSNFGGFRGHAGRMTIELQKLGIFSEKRIPEIYKRASIEQRLELLAGLIDTDGHVEKKTGRVRIVTGSKNLAKDIHEIASSLGFRPYLGRQEPSLSTSGIQGRKVIFTIAFQPDCELPVCLERKKIRRFAKRRRIGLIKVERLNKKVQGRCIQVDSDDGLYLVGKTLLPTHNSELVSRRFPAFALGNNPDLQIISASYASDLAKRMSRDVQRIIDTEEYRRIFPETRLSASNVRMTAKGSWLRRADIFEIVGKEGVYRAAGVGGGITGMGASIGIIDDPLKNMEQALSEVIREAQWEWYTSTFLTRLDENDSRILLTMTRWHEDDLAGRLLEVAKGNPDADQWVVLNLPAILEELAEYDPRKPGDVLWSAKANLQKLNNIKALNRRVWDALYQQRPSAKEGNIFLRKSFRYYSKLPERFEYMLQSWDMAFKNGPDNSFVVGQVWGRLDGKNYLVYQYRKQLRFSETQKALALVTTLYPNATKKLIEDKANGTAVMESMGKTISGMQAVNPGRDSKETRWVAASGIVDGGCVYIPDPVQNPWVADFLDEVCGVPNTKFNDQADAMTQAILEMDKNSIDDLKRYLGIK